jgi:hypothetical protein
MFSLLKFSISPILMKGREDGDVFAAMPGSVLKNQPRISTKVETTVNTCGYEEESMSSSTFAQLCILSSLNGSI